jgi:phage-related protein
MASAASLAPKSSTVKAKAPAPSASAPSTKMDRTAAPPVRSTLPVFARTNGEGSATSVASGGHALDSVARQRFEMKFQRDLSQVRIHPDSQAKINSVVPGARALTIGNDIYFSSGQYAPGSEAGLQLLAHELTHSVQQESAAGTSLGRMGSTADRFESEARRNAEIAGSTPVTVRERTSAKGPQPDEESPGFFYRLLIRYFPEIEPILKRGVLGWLQDRVLEGVQAIVDRLMEPVRTVAGIAESLSSHFTQLSGWIKKAAASIAKGDCSVLHEAVDYVEQAVSGLVSPILDKIKEVGKKIGGFFKGIWEKFGAPIWNEIVKIGGKASDLIQQFATWIWDKTKPIRDWAGRAWRWVKNKLGIGEGPEGQNGLLQWVEEKAEKAWDWIKVKIEPIKKPLLVVAGILVMLSPAGPIIAVGAAVGGIIEGVRAIKRYFGTKGGVVSARQILQTVVLPKIIQVIRGFAGILAEKASWLIGKVRGARDSVREAATAASESIFSFLAGLLQWIADCLDDFVKWGEEKVADFLEWIDHAASGLVRFLDRILNFLDEVAEVVKDILRLPFLLMGKIWKAIPACIRDPFVDFFGVQILGRIAIFKALAGTPEAWAKTKAEVGVIIKEFFVDFNLTGAMKHAFLLLLRALNVPLELLEAVLGKLVAAWDTLKEKPVEFLKNLWETIKLAFKGFFKRILTHLKNGIVGWLTSSLEGANISWPHDWTDPAELFGFVTSVLGLSVDHVLDRIALKYPERAAQLRKIIKVATGAWEWISLLARGDFKGLWEKIKGKISNLYDMVMQGVVDWLMKQVIQGVMMQLMTTADPTGVSEIVMIIVDTYRTIKTAVKYMRQILTMMNTMLDSILNIAAGVLQPAADLIEGAFDRGMPVVIGFLANLVGLGDIGEGIQEALEKVREKVDEGIDWLIEKAGALIEKVVGAVKGVVAMLFPPEKFTVGEDEHTVSAEEAGTEYRLTIQSEKREYIDFKQYVQTTAEKAGIKGLDTDLAGLQTEYEAWQAMPPQPEAEGTEAPGAAAKSQEQRQEEEKKKVAKFKDVAQIIKKILKKLPSEKPPKSTPAIPGPMHGNIGGSSMTIALLTANREPGQGTSEITIEDEFWDEIKPGAKKGKDKGLRRGKNSKKLYVRGHLLSAKLGGKVNPDNLTPLTYSANKTHDANVESSIKDLVGDSPNQASAKGMVSYTVKVEYIPNAPPTPEEAEAGLKDEETLLATGLETEWWQLVPDPENPSQQVKTGAAHIFTVDNVPPYPQM